MLVAKQFGVFLHLQEVLVWLLLIVGPGNSQPLAILGLLLVEPVLIPVDVDPARDVRKHAGRILRVTLQLTDAGAQLRVGPRPRLLSAELMASAPLLHRDLSLTKDKISI